MCNFLHLVCRPRWRREGALRAHDDVGFVVAVQSGSLPKFLKIQEFGQTTTRREQQQGTRASRKNQDHFADSVVSCKRTNSHQRICGAREERSRVAAPGSERSPLHTARFQREE